MYNNPIISLLTDFGLNDAYVGAIKGVILGICPKAKIVDISHNIFKHNTLNGAFILSQVSSYFPEGSIHLAVVDPGVGTARRRIIIKGSLCFYVGPDNGIFSLAVKKEGKVKAVEIKNEKFMLPNPSRTFEGRDVFAPVAAHIANGVYIEKFGPEIRDLVSFSIAEPEKRNGELLAKIVYVDGFGNITTNISKKALGEIHKSASIRVTIGNITKKIPFCNTYDEVSIGSALLTLGSSDFLEVAVNQGSAEKLFKAKVDDRVVLAI